MASTYDFNITQGSEFSVTFNVTNESGTPYDLNVYGVSGIAKHRYGDTTTLINLNPSGVLGFLDSGRFEVKLYASETQALPVCQGVYGIEIFSGQGVGQFVDKAVKGKFNVHPEVNKA